MTIFQRQFEAAVTTTFVLSFVLSVLLGVYF
jgi:hypothetical protein